MMPTPAGVVDQGLRLHGKTVFPPALLLGISLLLQLALGLFLGHAYDMRIYLATGYLVGTGQDPYIARDLSSIFHSLSFQGITSVGYPPPWPLVTGLIYLVSYRIIPNLLLYNLALKIPIIAANICLAYLAVRILKRLGASEKVSHRAWLFMLFNPLLLYTSVAWGQFDSIVALLSLLALVFLSDGKINASAVLLGLAIAFKPTALPLIPAVFIFLLGKPFQRILQYFSLLSITIVVVCVAPFVIFRWDPTPILQHWNAHFTVGGGMSFMTFLELLNDSYQLPGLWWLVGLLWVPALGLAAVLFPPGGEGLMDLLKKSLALTMIFFLFRTWLSEPNLILILPMVLILTSVAELDSRILTAVWVVPLVYSFFNTSTFQLLFPSMPDFMQRLLQLSDVFRTARLAIRTILVIPWLLIGSWIVVSCMKGIRLRRGRVSVTEI
jgi:hypothetical protein